MRALLSELSWPEVRERAAAEAILAIPLGSTEQHGPHLPLSTDTDVAVALCVRLAQQRPNVLVAPPVPYASSGEHAGFPGTLSIGQTATELLVLELVRSATETFAHILLVSAHGGNAEPVRRAVTALHAEGRDVLLYQPASDGDAHAGRTETSMQLHLHPWLVAIERAAAGQTRPLPEILPALRAGGVRAVSPNGVLGDPTGSSADDGRKIVDELAADLADRVAAWRRW
jgi:creatinine amidohydrolase